MKSLSENLFQQLNRSVLNPGDVYRISLSRGLRVDFLTTEGKTFMQISRENPSTPSDKELETCLKSINVQNPANFVPIKFSYENRNYLKVTFATPQLIK